MFVLHLAPYRDDNTPRFSAALRHPGFTRNARTPCLRAVLRRCATRNSPAPQLGADLRRPLNAIIQNVFFSQRKTVYSHTASAISMRCINGGYPECLHTSVHMRLTSPSSGACSRQNFLQHYSFLPG
ncbi:hypothetical protein NDU88_005126 [Pleurodeles waltl]|uniref:Uncharacterized protein n=1 Tax=Pleurodeles waltl TaxID=8319 RepID=A0AAV7SKS2_PLEWA|nr:hypothetical protein NDU88_005126 [Pleurodeles waltl]